MDVVAATFANKFKEWVTTMYTTNVLQLNLPRFLRSIKSIHKARDFYRGEKDDFADVTETFHYLNRTGKHLFVGNRSGVNFKINHTHKESIRGLIVVRKIIVRRNTDVVYDNRTLSANKPSSPESLAMTRWLNPHYNRQHFQTQFEILNVEYFIPLEDIEKDSRGVYISELDLLVGVTTDKTDSDKIMHPYSEVADTHIMENNYSDVKEELGGITPFGFLIVDHNNEQLPRFMRVGNNIYEIPRTNDKRMLEGFHVSTPKPYNLRSVDTPVDHRIMSLEEADKEYRLTYRYEEALLQDQLVDNKAKFAEMNLRNKQTNLQSEELDYKQENLRLSRELDERKRIHEQEMRTYVRRKERRYEWLDVAKTVLGFVTTGFLIYKAFKYK